MKKLSNTLAIYICFAFMFAVLLPGKAHAVMQVFEIAVEFSFDTGSVSGKEVSGYKLYREGVDVCQVGVIQPQVMSCMIAGPGTYDFTLAVLFNDDSESPQSAPFQFSVTDEQITIKGLQALTGQQPPDLEGYGDIAGNSTIGLEDIIHSLRQMSHQ